MEDRIYFKEKEKAISVFKWTLGRQKSFSIAYWILLFLSFPAIDILLMILSDSASHDVYEGSDVVMGYIETMEYCAYQIAGTAFSVIAIAHSLILGVMTFSYMHNKRSVDLYGSLPVSRKTMFFSRYCALVLSNIVPILVMGSVGALMTLKGSTILAVYKVIGILILATIGNISFIAFISLCCGTVGDVIVSYAIVNIVYPICVFICNAFPIQIVPGLTQDMFPTTVYTLFTPVAAHFTAVFGNGLNIYAIWWIAFTIVLLSGCLILCKRRKAETAQNAFAFPVVEIVVKFITCFAAGFGMGWIMTYVGNVGQTRGTQWIWFSAGMIIGVMVSNGLLHLIFHRGFSKFKSSLKECLVVCGADIVFLMFITSGIVGFDTRMPDVSDIESVYIGYDDDQPFVVDGKNLLEDYHDDEEIIQAVIDLHKNYVENISEIKLNGFYPIIRYGYLDENWSNMEVGSVKIKYKLKNGTIMTRYYAEFYGRVHFSETLKNLPGSYKIALENIPTKYIWSMNMVREGADGIEYNSYSIDVNDKEFREEDIAKIVEALNKDLETVYSDADNVGAYYNNYDDTDSIYILGLNYYSPDPDPYYNSDIYNEYYITEEYVNTLKALEETGYGNIDFYALCSNYYVNEEVKVKGYEQTGDSVYFRKPESWDENLEVHCVPYSSNDFEYLLSLSDERTVCEEVSDGVYKYVIPEGKKYNTEIDAVMFYQYSKTDVYSTGIKYFPKGNQNLLIQDEDAADEFIWSEYAEQ